MSILNDLHTDHENAKAALTKILRATDSKDRKKIFTRFADELTAHSRAEEKVFYTRLRKTEEGKDQALEGTVEHHVVDRLIEDMKKNSNAMSDDWSAQCRVLKELLEHHIKEEEGDMFKTARKTFDAKLLEKMGEEFLAAKEKLGIAIPAAAE
jgi:hemerythrin superfamily protein